jgi:hypothetical protein
MGRAIVLGEEVGSRVWGRRRLEQVGISFSAAVEFVACGSSAQCF